MESYVPKPQRKGVSLYYWHISELEISLQNIDLAHIHEEWKYWSFSPELMRQCDGIFAPLVDVRVFD